MASLENEYLPGQRVRNAILPVFNSWLNRKHGHLGYFSTQMITGHGSFREFTFKIRKSVDEKCLHCDALRDTVEHMWSVCPA